MTLSNKQKLGLIYFLLAAVTLGLYSPGLSHGFTSYDDPLYITLNPLVAEGLTWNGVVQAFTGTYACNWHPLTWLSHMVDCQLFGLNATGHHAMNFLLHTVNVLLLFHLLRHLTGAIWRSAAVALLFAVHPLHVESVAWVAERKDLLSACFFLLTVLAYARYVELTRMKDSKRKGFYILSLALFALGLMAKPMLVTLPCVLLLLDYWPLNRIPPREAAKPDDNAPAARSRLSTALYLVQEKLPFFGLALISSWITVVAQSQGQAVVPTTYYPLWARLENVPVAYVWYLAKTIWPTHLTVIYPIHLHPNWLVIASVLFLALVTRVALTTAQGRPYFLVSWLWFVGMLVPVIGLLQVGNQSYADRYSYLPHIGLFILVIWGAAEVASRWRFGSTLLAGVIGASVIALAAVTTFQLRFWKNTDALFNRAVAINPRNYIAWYVLGLERTNHKQWPEAEECYRNAIESNPLNYDPWNNLGQALYAQRKLPEARDAFEQALKLAPNQPEIHANLALLFHDTGQTNEAIAECREAIRLDPFNPKLHSDLGDFLAARRDYDDAILQYRQTLQFKPDSAYAHVRLGEALAAQGRNREALSELQQALALDTKDASIYTGLAIMNQAVGDDAAAARYYREALERNTNAVTALNNLAWLLATHPDGGLRNGPEAIRLAERACDLTERKEAMFVGTLAAAYAEAGKFDEAIQTVKVAMQLAEASGQTNLVARNTELLELYRSGKPFRESPSRTE